MLNLIKHAVGAGFWHQPLILNVLIVKNTWSTPNAHAMLYQNGFITITYDQHVFCKLHIRVVYEGGPTDDTYLENSNDKIIV